MTDINKEKFLTELGKLLTFMYEEDRQHALALYSRMFDHAEDEMALIQLLGSPTRQAVIVARAYNAREHKLDVYSHSRETAVTADGGELPDYVRAINQIHQTAVSQNIVTADVADGQFTLFSDDDSGLTERYSYEDVSAVPAEPASVWEAEPVLAAPVPVEVSEPAAQEEPAPVQEEGKPVEEPAPEAPIYAEPSAPAREEPEAAEIPASPEADAPAILLIEDEELAAEPVAAEPAPEAPSAPAIPEEAAPAIEILEEAEDAPAVPAQLVRKPKTFLLILYILAFAPLTLLGIGLLLIPTLFFLGLAVSVIAAGAMVLIAAFSGFAVLADIMVVLGLALIILALGLLFLWIFIWFIGGAIVGLVRGVFTLGGKWCYKEVPAV